MTSAVCALDRGSHIILYADDILLIAPTVSKIENLLHICERELYWLDMSINFNTLHAVCASDRAVTPSALT